MSCPREGIFSPDGCFSLVPIFLFFVLGPLLNAQTRQLPVVEIMGEAKVQMPLAPRSAPLFQAAVPVDSLPYFTPSSLPRYSGSILPFYPPLKGKLEARLGTDWITGLKARLYRTHPMVPYLRMDMEGDYLPNHFERQSYYLYAQAIPDSSLKFDTQIKYLIRNADAYHNNAFSMTFFHSVDSLQDRSWGLRKVINRLWWESSSQLHSGLRTSHKAPGFWHSHTLSIGNHSIDTQLGSSMGRFGLSSAYVVHTHVKGVKKMAAGLMSDIYHLLPLVDIHYEKVISPRLRLQAGNYPTMHPFTRTEVLELFPWAGQARLGRARMNPLDLKVRLEMALPGKRPALISRSPAQNPEAALNQLSLCLRSAYIYNQPVLRQSAIYPIPSQSFEPLWHNSLRAEAAIRLPWLWMGQTLDLQLEHLPHQRGTRAPYSPLITSTTRLRYSSGKLDGELELLQIYNREDQFGRDLKEFIDINLSANYLLCSRVSLTVGIDNLLGNRLIFWKGLPPKTRELNLGVSWLWR